MAIPITLVPSPCFKKLSGAQVAIMQGDVAMVEDGGKSDFHYGKDWQIMGSCP
ncbi:MAG: hypothetical protein U0V70_02525 [Terriglobia bacterium]